MQDHTQALREALQGFLDFHTKPAGISVELITEKELFTQALADIGKREDALIAAARAALSSHQAATDKESARDAALEQAANLVECEYAHDKTQAQRLAQIAQHIRDLKKRSQS